MSESVIGRVTYEKEGKEFEVLELGAGMRYPFRFGRGKAKMLLEAIAALGAEGFANHLQEYMDDTDPDKETR